MNLSEHVTIVISTYNRQAELRQTLDHLLAQDHQAPIIVVDNGSTDATVFMLAKERRVHAVLLKENIGAAARNIGVALAATPCVALVDDDTRWEPDALPRGVARPLEHPCLAGVTGRMLVGPHGIEDPISRTMAASPLRTLPGFAGPVVLGFLAGPARSGEGRSCVREASTAGCSWVVKRSCWRWISQQMVGISPIWTRWSSAISHHGLGTVASAIGCWLATRCGWPGCAAPTAWRFSGPSVCSGTRAAMPCR